MPLDLPKAYEAVAVEGDVYRRWEEAGCLRAGAGARPGRPAYVIAMPPPNVTGILHIGHALNNTLQDTLIRWRRMQGCDTLWQPGTDHAGIATESVVAKRIQDDPGFLADLAKAGITPEQPADPAATRTATGQDRDRFGRTAFLKAMWFFKEQSGGTITRQLRMLGASCDWSRERFTMDAGLSHAVRTQFVRLHEAGLIYRGMRMVNWCPVQRTALADDEVEYIEKQGHLWKLRYELEDGSGHVVVETTRPETLFGDTAVAVHPTDPRYVPLIGRRVRLPVIGRLIPIVADEHADPTKGSGAVKITPAHDPNDYEVGKRHALALVRCIGLDGTMTAEAGAYAGLDRVACRKQLIRDLEASGTLLGSTEITHAVGHSYRSNAPIEPMVTEQWFVAMRPLAERAVAETRGGGVAFHPERWTKVYCDWLTHVRDWCISRQIWWGHRIPAWHCAACGATTVAVADPDRCGSCGATAIKQDPDVLDTWFSSALWPFSTLGWPEAGAADLARYYPTSTLVTDRGIIYFWVARMVMAGLFALDRKPFSDVYIHGTVLDERGVKMSKSLGNGIDPIVMIQGGVQRYLGKDYQCAGYGADAVRYTLLDMTTEGQDLKLSPAKFETGRNFANKVWNAGRFVLLQMAERPLATPPTVADLARLPLGFPERWLLGRLQAAIDGCTQSLERFRFNDYANGAYRFFRDDLCDWYVEWAKRRFKAGGSESAMAAQVLSYAFEAVLRLLHPGMPFLTEYLWQQVQATTGGAPWSGRHLMTEAWPEPVEALRFAGTAERMAERQALVTAVRNVRNQAQLADGVALAAVLAAPDAAAAALAEEDRAFLMDRAHLTDLAIAVAPPRPPASVTAVVGAWKVHVPMTGLVDLAAFAAGLGKRAISLEKSIAGKQARLGNADYAARAPAAQVAETRDLLAREQVELANLRETIAGLA
jgi:valyl-tRNA synthetase